MILVLNKNAVLADADQLCKRLADMGLTAIKKHDERQISVAIVNGLDVNTKIEYFQHLPYVERIEKFSQPFKLAGNDLNRQPSVIDMGNIKIGGGDFCIMAGPCAVENEEQIHRIAQSVSVAGANILRGGVFKPRTSPYDFQGLGKQGLRYLREAARNNQLLSITEVMEISQIELCATEIDILQIGARNMQNFSLLKELGRVKNPIMLKRGLSATYKEFLMAAEYILNAGNLNVILCERGIRTFETYTRNTLDIGAVPVLKSLSHLPVIIDPSHGTGIRSMIAPMSCAAAAVGADGVMIEVHYDPDKSYSDAQQAINVDQFTQIVKRVKAISETICAK